MQFYATKHTQVLTAGAICKLWKLKRAKATPILQYDRLLINPNMKSKHIDSVKRRYNGLNENGSMKGDTLREALVTSEIKITPKNTRQTKK